MFFVLYNDILGYGTTLEQAIRGWEVESDERFTDYEVEDFTIIQGEEIKIECKVQYCIVVPTPTTPRRKVNKK